MPTLMGGWSTEERAQGAPPMSDEENALIARALEILQARARGVASTPTVTVGQLAAHYEAAKKRSKGWRVMKVQLRAVVETVYSPGTPPLGQREAMSLKVLDWSDYRAHRAEHEYKPGRKYTDHSLNLELGRLKALLNWSVVEGRIPHNPIAAARRHGKKSKRETAPTEADVGAQLAESDPRRRFIVLASADAGMRRNEIRLCEYEWADRAKKRIHLSAAACKGGKARTVPATTRLLDAMEAVPRHFRAPWVLTNPETGQPYHNNSLSRWFRELADAAGVQAAPGDRRPHLHDNRHGAATNAAARGVPLPAIQKMLGHEHLSTTEIYINARNEDYESALRQIEDGILREQRRYGPQRIPYTDDAETKKNKG